MLDGMIRFALKHRLFVLAMAAFLLVYGSVVVRDLPIDVFPDLTKPTVTIMSEAHGLAPEEVEILVTFPIESALSGIAGVERIRSTSGIGLSVIYVEFGWGEDIYRSRQLVAERLQLARNNLPPDIQPVLGPITSLMGQIQQIALSSADDSISPRDLRSLAEWRIRPQLMTIPGVAQIIVMGGGLRQYQILVSAEKMNRYQITLEELDLELRHISQNSAGGFIEEDGNEILVRNIGTIHSLEDLESTAIGMHFGRPVLLRDISTVQEGTRFKRGEASYMGRPAVILVIQKQPHTDTVEITEQVDDRIQQLKSSLPGSITIDTEVFRQADFILASINGIIQKLQIGSILVFIVLLIFLANLRMSLITLTAIPLSFMTTFIIFQIFGLSINTMTLGGLAIAIGELVDDSIVDVENIYRRLRENKLSAVPKSILKVVFAASSEIRNSIVLATIIIALVFLPLVNLSGLEGRLFTPLALSYLTALLASLIISLTITPVLCFYLLKRLPDKAKDDTWLVRQLKRFDRSILTVILGKPWLILIPALIALVGAFSLVPLMGRDFLPQFQERTAMVTVFTPPGTSLAASNEIGRQAELLIMQTPGIKSVSRRTGRADQDEHAMAVNVSEIDVDFVADLTRSRDQILDDMRQQLADLQGIVGINMGQPLAHLIDHLLSGVSAQLAIKVFGPELTVLRAKAAEIRRVMTPIPGVVDVRVEQLGLIQQVKIYVMRDEAARYGLSAGHITSLLETAFNGQVVAQVVEDQKVIDVFCQFDMDSRGTLSKMEEAIIKILPDGSKIRVRDVADVYRTEGPNEINRENLARRIVISSNVSGRDLTSVVAEVEQAISAQVSLPVGYFISYGGQFEAQQTASRDIFLFGILSLLGIALVLFGHFRSWLLVAQIMFTIPMAFIGGITLLYLMNGIISIASLIGFVTLCGIASRNGIMMISHYLHLLKFEGEQFTKDMVIRGSLERLVPVMMTASVTTLALLPIVFAKGQPGSEILQPVATVVVGGLFSSTLLDILVTPVLFYWFGRRAAKEALAHSHNQEEIL